MLLDRAHIGHFHHYIKFCGTALVCIHAQNPQHLLAKPKASVMDYHSGFQGDDTVYWGAYGKYVEVLLAFSEWGRNARHCTMLRIVSHNAKVSCIQEDL